MLKMKNSMHLLVSFSKEAILKHDLLPSPETSESNPFRNKKQCIFNYNNSSPSISLSFVVLYMIIESKKQRKYLKELLVQPSTLRPDQLYLIYPWETFFKYTSVLEDIQWRRSYNMLR